MGFKIDLKGGTESKTKYQRSLALLSVLPERAGCCTGYGAVVHWFVISSGSPCKSRHFVLRHGKGTPCSCSLNHPFVDLDAY